MCYSLKNAAAFSNCKPRYLENQFYGRKELTVILFQYLLLVVSDKYAGFVFPHSLLFNQMSLGDISLYLVTTHWREENDLHHLFSAAQSSGERHIAEISE